MLDGYRDVIAHPRVLIDLPEEIVKATDKANQATNLYGRWIVEETAPSDNPDEWLTVDESWIGFQEWCREQNEKPETKRKFGDALSETHPTVVKRKPVGDDKSATIRLRRGLTWSEVHHARKTRERARARAEAAAQEAALGGFVDHS